MPDPSRADFGAVLARNVEMRARDGLRLATDVWRPAAERRAGARPLPGGA